MSDNRPPIYGRCPAGCEWETVHKSDFDAAATFIKVNPQESGEYSCNPLRLYKVETLISTTNPTSYLCEITFEYANAGVKTEYPIAFSEFDAYRGYIYFEILALIPNTAETELTIVYEVNGNRYTDKIVDTNIDISEPRIKFSNALSVYKHNEWAEITGRDGKSAYESAVEAGYTDTETAFNADLAAIQGLASELEGLL